MWVFLGCCIGSSRSPLHLPLLTMLFSKVKFFDCIKSNLSVLYLPKWFKPRKVAHFKTRISYLFIHKFEYWSNSFRQRLNRTLMSNYNQSGFRKIFMKFRSVVNVRKFLDFFINYQVKFVSQICNVVRDNYIFSFMCCNMSLFIQYYYDLSLVFLWEHIPKVVDK